MTFITMLPDAFAASKEPPNLLFIIMDTLRADHVGCYGYGKVETPAVDGLARQGVLFENVVCQVPMTLPSHCSIFTGTNPTYHGVRDNGFYYLDQSAVTLAEVLKQNGYRTAAVIGSFVLEAKFGLDQGFDEYFDEMGDQQGNARPGYVLMKENLERRAAAVSDDALQWLRANKEERFFLWLHYYDPHDPYEPPAPYAQRYAERPYDGEIAYADFQIARVLEELSNLQLSRKTVIVFASDHGEGLGEHKEPTHGIFLYDTTTKVPLIICAPGKLAEGKRVEAQVRTIDIMPTVLSLLDVSLPKEVQGLSVLPLMQGKKFSPLVSYSESYHPRYLCNWSELKCLRTDRWKYIEAPTPELYDLGSDPAELTNLAEKETKRATQFQAELSKVERETSKEGPEVTARRKPDQATIEKLQSLGYVGPVGSVSALTPGDKTDLPDPKERIEALSVMDAAEQKISQNQPEAALALIDKGLKIDPENFNLRYQLAQCHIMKSQYEKAVQVLSRLVTEGPQYPRSHFELASAYARLGRYDEAIQEGLKVMELDEHSSAAPLFLAGIYRAQENLDRAQRMYERVLQLDPENAEAHARLGELLEDQGKSELALKHYEKALGNNPRDLKNLNNLANLHDTLGNHDQAERYYREALKIDPNHILTLLNLGVSYGRQGKKAEAIQQFERVLQLDPQNQHARQFLRAVQQ